ncbi:MAG: nucleoside 2-deoxyribosyltransferase [Pseudomonas sp.]|uniref:nucleoside 2-deoxyribosyltransferase n=1 Tax=Pseudomonas abieticivorans TaxID=2931382 RepID=UPI0020BE48B1|nr:nucleoside 2-deoxyribosyltransferase [Pseudomonas sp. PIA16]MDE1166603.1 nucleoside 2-deoxyribosyltransferase [Pseudomonas sp.]
MDAPPVYLAGFDVFRRDAIEQGRTLKRLCAEQGLLGLYPFDNQIPANLSPTRSAALICQQNIAMIRESHAVLANLNLFRGLEPDSGTAFEMGMAVALGKPVWVYFEPVDSLRDLVPHDAEGFDAQGYQVEDFSLPRNLMLACTWAGSSTNAEHAVSDLSAYLQSHVSEEHHRG